MPAEIQKLNADVFSRINGRKAENRNGPETILQFGEGNFLRAFCDWMVHRANRAGVYNGRIVVVQPRNRPQGTVAKLKGQDCLYNVFVRGRNSGQAKVVDETETVESISHGINPYTHWDEFLDCATNEELRFVLSNTTEAGVVYTSTPRPVDTCPNSFPAKLTELLYRRWRYFNLGHKSKALDGGLIILPCELIDNNGVVLRDIVLRHASDWSLESNFTEWLNSTCSFCNTLVDRIVPGFPVGEEEATYQRLGCEDELAVACEPYHIWAVEADESVRKLLPLEKCEGVNLVWTDNLQPYRYRKVRILNGGHMTMVPAGLLGGCELVGQALDDNVVGGFVRATLEKEILPTLDMPEKEKDDYLSDTLARFANPFIHHKLHTISLNSTSKFRVRLLETLLEYIDINKGKIPPRMTLVFAALIAMYKGTELREGMLICQHGDTERLMNDNTAVLEKWAAFWQQWENDKDTQSLCESVLAMKDWWGCDLNEISGLCEMIDNHLQGILDSGARSQMEQLQ